MSVTARSKLSYLLAPSPGAAETGRTAFVAPVDAEVRSGSSPDSDGRAGSPGASTDAGSSVQSMPEKLDSEVKDAQELPESEFDGLRRELRETQAQLAEADRVAEVLREAVADLRERLMEHTDDLPPHPLEHEQCGTSVRRSNQQTHDCCNDIPQVLGIAKKLCGGCRRSCGVTSRVFVEARKLYCEDCWKSWETRGWWRPSIRVSTVPPPISEALGGLPHFVAEDAFCLPAFLCAHNDLSLFQQLKGELPEGRDFSDWHGSRHMGIQFVGAEARHNSAVTPPALKATVARLEAAFGMRATASRLNLYRSRDDYKPFHYDRGSDSQGNPQMTVGASFGAMRELTFMHVSSGVTATFPQRNGDVFAFTSELNNVFMHGVPKIGFGSPSMLEPDMPRLSLILWGSKIQKPADES